MVTHVPHHCLPVSHMLLNSPIKLVAECPEQTVSITYILIHCSQVGVDNDFILLSVEDIAVEL